jgi:spore coat protein U-like protein
MALAGTGQQVSVTGNVTGGCNTLSPLSGTLAFGSYDVFGTSDVTAGPVTFSINCTKNDPNFTVSVSGGSNFTHANPSGDRAMTDSKGTFLTYQLYQSNGTGALPWSFSTSTGAGTAVNETANGLLTASTFSLYGVLPKGQTSAGGPGVSASFTDSVTVTVNF